MRKNFKHHSSSVSPDVEPDMVDLIRKIQQQLVFLERKIDTLIGQSSEKTFGRRHFPAHHRSFEYSHHRGREKQDGTLRERNFSHRGRFERGQDIEEKGFAGKKKPFYKRRKEGF